MTDEPKPVPPFAEGGYVKSPPEVAVPAVLRPGEHRFPKALLDELRDKGSAVIGIDPALPGGDRTSVVIIRQNAGQIAEVMSLIDADVARAMRVPTRYMTESPPCRPWAGSPGDPRPRSHHYSAPAVDIGLPEVIDRVLTEPLMARWCARMDRNTMTQIRLGMSKRAFQRYRGRLKAKARRMREHRTRVYYATKKHLRARTKAIDAAIVETLLGDAKGLVASAWHCPHGLRINERCRDCKREHLEATA